MTENALLALPTGAEISSVGLSLGDSLTREQWNEVGQQLSRCGGALQWWVGDWLNYGEKQYGEIKDSVESLGFKYSTATTWAWVAREIEPSRRLESLSWSHHHAAASHPDKKERRNLLATKTEDGKEVPKYTVKEIRDAVREHKLAVVREENPWPSGKYRVIYADPPWSYNDERMGTVSGGGATAHYPLMPTEKICELPVPEIVLDASVLFLWGTSPLLPDALQVIAAWGFDYKSSFVWDKVRGFNGHYNDVRHELLLVATRGSCVPKVESLPSSVVTIEKTRHSAKPDRFREIIDSLYPEGPRVELFARTAASEGWHVWGNQAVC